MSSSNDSFGWSDVWCNTMTSEDYSNDSNTDKETQKKKHEKFIQQVSPQGCQEHSSSEANIIKKTKKKKKVKEEIITSDGEEAETKLPEQEGHSHKKLKKINIKTEPENSIVNLEYPVEETSQKEIILHNRDIDNVVIKLETAKKKKKRKQSDALDEDTLAVPPPKKKKKKNNFYDNSNVETDDKYKVHQKINYLASDVDCYSTSRQKSNSLNYSNNGDIAKTTNEIDESSLRQESVHRKSYPSVESRKRTSISEQNQFEDDTDRIDSDREFIECPKEITFGKKVTKFIEKNPQLTLVPVDKTIDIIEEQDEAWIVKCPRDFNHSMLKDLNFTIERKIKLKLDGTTFEGVLDENTHRTAVLLPISNKLEIRGICPKGILTFRKKIPKVDAKEIHIIPTRDTFIPLPETKKRHPLFGPKFKKFVHLPPHIKEKLSDLSPRKKFKSKNKNNDKIEQLACKEEPTQIEDVVDAPLKKKKKKKRKHSEDADEEIHKKKFKHNPEVWDSEKAIESSLFNF